MRDFVSFIELHLVGDRDQHHARWLRLGCDREFRQLRRDRAAVS